MSAAKEGLTAVQVAQLGALQEKYSVEYFPHINCERSNARDKVISVLEGTPEEEDPLWIIDLSTIARQFTKWTMNFPNVTPFYAIKCNTTPIILDTLLALGASFDCASKSEIALVLSHGGTASKIIFANPCKQVSHIKYARDCGVEMTTVDNESELIKLKAHWPTVKVVIRIATDDSAAVCQFSSKFGATLEYAEELLIHSKNLGLNVIGVSFHVGSGCGDAKAFVQAALNAHLIFQKGTALGFNMTLLDIGGGFPGDSMSKPTIEDISNELMPTLNTLFQGINIIAEPGRYFACASHTLAAKIYSKRIVESDPGKIMRNEEASGMEYQYYINDGLYHSFNCIMFDHAIIQPFPLFLSPSGTYTDPTLGSEDTSSHRPTTIFGPTCDSLDCIAKRIPMPELNVGDWLYFTNMGAYTSSAASRFNGFDEWRVVYRSAVDYISITKEAGEYDSDSKATSEGGITSEAESI